MPLRQLIKKLTRCLSDLSFQPSVMMVTPVPGQQTLNWTICLSTSQTTNSKHGPTSSFVVGSLTPDPTSAIEATISYQNMLIIFFAFSINIHANVNFIFF
ncbi:hypothetical protein AMTRI_Chr09g36350 [Amborella trichopoda]